MLELDRKQMAAIGETQLRNNLTFNAGQRAVINVPMKLSTIQETITVAGEAPLIQVTTSEISTTIERKAFETLPVAQRNQGPLAVNMRERESDQARLEIELRRIDREVAATRAAYESRRAELRALAEEAVPAAERNLLLIETGWRSGRFDIFRVTSAARDLVRMKAMRLDALEAAWVERIALERAAGGWPS